MFEHFRHTFVISSSFPTVFITSVKVSGSFVKVSTSFPQIYLYFLSSLPLFTNLRNFSKKYTNDTTHQDDPNEKMLPQASTL